MLVSLCKSYNNPLECCESEAETISLFLSNHSPLAINPTPSSANNASTNGECISLLTRTMASVSGELLVDCLQFQYEYYDHIYTASQPEIADIVRGWRDILDEFQREDGKSR